MATSKLSRVCKRLTGLGVVTTVIALGIALSMLVPKSVNAAPLPVPPQGAAVTCYLAVPECNAELDQMKAAGLSFVMVTLGAFDPTTVSEYAQHAHQIGMGIIWELDDPSWWTNYSPAGTNLLPDYPQTVGSCGCTTNGQLLTYLISMLAAQPATLGYYLADDSQITPADKPALTVWAGRVKAIDPHGLGLIGHYGTGDLDGSDLAQYAGAGDSETNEFYPIITTYREVGAQAAQVAASTQRVMSEHGQLTTYFLQSFSWGDNLTDGKSVHVCTLEDTLASCAAKLISPSEAEELEMRNAVISNSSPALIIWWYWPSEPSEQQQLAAVVQAPGPEPAPPPKLEPAPSPVGQTSPAPSSNYTPPASYAPSIQKPATGAIHPEKKRVYKKPRKHRRAHKKHKKRRHSRRKQHRKN